MEIKVGDEVQVIDELLKGKVTAITAVSIKFLCEDGFEYTYPKSSIMFIDDDKKIHTAHKEHEILKMAVEEIEQKGTSIPILFKGKVPEFDIHIDCLAPDAEFKTQHDALLFQLDYARSVILKAIQQRIRRIVFIHGVGKGVLRNELRKLIGERFPGIEYFDGSYSKYGHGATEIIIHDFIRHD